MKRSADLTAVGTQRHTSYRRSAFRMHKTRRHKLTICVLNQNKNRSAFGLSDVQSQLITERAGHAVDATISMSTGTLDIIAAVDANM